MGFLAHENHQTENDDLIKYSTGRHRRKDDFNEILVDFSIYVDSSECKVIFEL